ncbi:putative general secretion pathway protein H [Magnetofaba australis IT-1]|uniref:Type II secretion system protein H n=1 Tax=Magnetofaba australis IT-1 TaxID=1434232 RepID=A0A1Y2K6R2_9PROT|nr:putative general secretion pathway protein H [Magnetofaba australis IT-1]
MLVVVFIMALMVSMAALSVNTAGDDRVMEEEAKRFTALMRLATQEAITRSEDYGVRFVTTGFDFVRFDEEKRVWTPVTDGETFRPRQLPPGIQQELSVEGLTVELALDYETQERKIRPHVLLFSSGEITPFELALKGPNAVRYEMTGSLIGEIKWDRRRL